MSRLTLRLPESLHQTLIQLAQEDGVSLNHFIVYALTRQTNSHYQVIKNSEENAQQQANFDKLLQRLKTSNTDTINQTLAQREWVDDLERLDPSLENALVKKLESIKGT